ncbi:MAG: protease pro-enzyme activation domain-containing protein [Candidatus Binataceae bacterium]
MYRWIKSILLVPLLLTIVSPAGAAVSSAIPGPDTHTATAMVRLPGHVLPALSKATGLPTASARENEPLTITLVLKRDHQAAFDKLLHDISDPHSKNFHQYLTQGQIADRFGPSRDDYDAVLAYLRTNKLALVEGSKNRLTITASGRRGAVEKAFDVHIGDYKLGSQNFFANDRDPALPQGLAAKVQAVSGLSDLARPRNATKAIRFFQCEILASLCWLGTSGGTQAQDAAKTTVLNACKAAVDKNAAFNMGPLWDFFCGAAAPKPMISPLESLMAKPQANPAPLPWAGLDGTGQTIGLVEFDNFETSDVSDYLAFTNEPASLINNLTEVNVNGGTSAGPNQDEVLLDIDTTLTMAPGAKTVVYDAPFNGGSSSFQAVFNQMVNDKVTIISNSWAYCEDQSSLADAQSIDTIFQNAAAAGISVFNGSGDDGSTCLDGSANTVAVPADSPNATAVGGSSEPSAPGLMYAPETWWNGSAANPPTGQGGFGVSEFFAAKSYQTVLSGSSMRMVPDLVMNADPAQGVFICQASNGGCPNGLEYGGTSIATPQWAAMTALLNQGQGSNLGLLNPQLYLLANTSAFHNAAALGSDFAHVGLGSPNLNLMYLALTGQSAGTPSATLSQIGESLPVPPSGIAPDGVPADGTTQLTVMVALRDANGNSVSGKTVMLSAGASTASISPSSAVTTIDNGVATFTVTDLTPENLAFTATDTTDGVQVAQPFEIPFLTPPAASAGLNVFPTSATADGVTPTDITVTLEDSLGRPSPGKLIQINQLGGNSVISGPVPPVTNSNGVIKFTATDQNDETVTYSAVDVTDGNIPFPQTGQVSFNDSPASGCATATPPAAPGFLVTPYATGFFAQSYAFGDVDFTCAGAYGMAFDSSGNLYVGDGPTGNIYKFPPGGGVAGNSTLLTTTALGQSLAGLVFDSSGNLYASFDTTEGGFTTGMVLQIDPSTGAQIRTVASNLTCPTALSIDPLSGDLFADDSCHGSGSDDTALWRISNPASESPAVSVYASLPSSPNANIAFAPSGTIYVWGPGTVAQVSGTNGPTPPTVANLPNVAVSQLGLLALGTQNNGDAQTLFANFPANGTTPALLGTYDLTTTPASPSTTLVNNAGFGNLIFGPDGCVYAAQNNAVYKITDTNGACTYAASTPAPALVLSPTSIVPNPVQGASQTMTASFHYVTVPTGTQVTFQVVGANPQIGNITTTANGIATFTYTAAHQGIDTITAFATVGSAPIASNQAVITWGAGTDVTFVSLNSSPRSAMPNQSVNLVASLTDASPSPAVPIAGQSISFTLGGSSCGGTTNASGIATCSTSAGSAGIKTLSASFAGTLQYVASNASIGFNVVAPPPTPTPTATPTPVAGKLRVAPRTLNFGTVDVGSSKVKTVKITNLGKITKKKHPVPILIESESGAASPFSITQVCDDDDLGPRSKGVKPGTCEVSVTFTPAQATKFEGTLMIKDNLEPGFGQSVGLKGAGKTPK